MKSSTVVLLALLVLGVGLFFLKHRKEAHGLEFGSTDEFIQFMAAEAVQDAAEKDHINLDYSVDSIKQVEEILGRLHEQYVKVPSSISAKGLGSAYGAYIGEVIRRSEPGAKWERDDAVGGEKSYPIIWGTGVVLSPYRIYTCQKTIHILADVWSRTRVRREKAVGEGFSRTYQAPTKL